MGQKIVIDKFKGVGIADRNLTDGQFSVGIDIDLYRDYAGYLTPGYAKTDITITGQNQDIIDIVSDGTYVFLYGNNGRVYQITISSNAVNANFGGAGVNYASIANMLESKGIMAYSVTDGAFRIYSFYDNGANIAKGNVGSTDWSGGDLDVDWGSTVPTGAGALTQGRRDVIEFNSLIFFTNGHYVGKLDVSVNPAVITLTAFNLGTDWAANRLFKTDNYIGIFASRGSNLAGDRYPSSSRVTGNCKLYLWDGVSTNAYKIVDLPGITQIHAVINKNGNIFAFVDGGTTGHYWTQLQSNGSEYYLEKVRKLQYDIVGTQLRDLLSPNSNSAIEQYKNNILFGTYAFGRILCIGRDTLGQDYQLSSPYSVGTDTNARVTAIKQVSTDKIYVAYFDGTNYKFASFTPSNSTGAIYKTDYKDFGQKIRINYVKFYFRPLVSGDSITPTIDTDYGTSNTLRDPRQNSVISFALDGAITSKKFKTKIDCHAFRIALSWAAGGTTFSKIVVDYDFIEDI